MSKSRQYSRAWLNRLPGMAAILAEISPDQTDWVSSTLVWTAAIRSAAKARDFLSNSNQTPFPLEALPAFLNIMSTANTLREALFLAMSMAKLANLPIQPNLEVDGEHCRVSNVYVGEDAQILADHETLHNGFVMAVLSWIVGEHIPYSNFYCRSADFLTHHNRHPDFPCALTPADRTGFQFPAAWLEAPVSPQIAEASVMEALIWLVYDRPEDLILPQQGALESEDLRVSHQTDNLPLFKSVGGRQKRRKLIAQYGLTLRELKQRFILRKSKFLLLDKSRTISDIATELGYSDSGSFRRFFNRMTGISPREYLQSPDCQTLIEISLLLQSIDVLNA
jgi:Helix-turn-helix domain